MALIPVEIEQERLKLTNELAFNLKLINDLSNSIDGHVIDLETSCQLNSLYSENELNYIKLVTLLENYIKNL